MKFLTRWFVRIPFFLFCAICVVAFSIANRREVLVSFDPFEADMPAIGLQMPLWMVVFATLLLGIVLGGTAAWTAQARASLRKAARQRAKKRDAEATAAKEQTPIIAPEKKISVLPPANAKPASG